MMINFKVGTVKLVLLYRDYNNMIEEHTDRTTSSSRKDGRRERCMSSQVNGMTIILSLGISFLPY